MLQHILQRVLLSNKLGTAALMTLLLLTQGITAVHAQTSRYTGNFVTITSRVSGAAGTSRYSTIRPSGDFTPEYQSKFLGTFNQVSTSSAGSTATDSLLISAESATAAGTGETVQSNQFFYRVVRTDNDAEQGSFIPLPLNLDRKSVV